MNLVCFAAGLITVALWQMPAAAAPFDYALQPQSVADGVYVLEGRNEHFSRDNGGNILNTGFISTGAGAVVIDSGPSRRYGEQQRALLARQGLGEVARVYVTHAHPDHFLGNQAYAVDRIAALPATTRAIQNLGEDLAANLYRMVGGWMEGTEAVAPGAEAVSGETVIGGRRLRLIALQGHTDADLAIYDEATRTLFAGDLVFFERAATTPNADIGQWLQALDQLDTIEFARLVPGHGPVVKDHAAIVQTRGYLRWLRDSLRKAAAQGMDLNEAMQIPVPEGYAKLAVFREEFQRSVVHLYPTMELETLKHPTH